MNTFFTYIFNYFILKTGIVRSVDPRIREHFGRKRTLSIILSSIIRHPFETVRALPLFFRYRKYGHISCSGEEMFLKRVYESVSGGKGRLYVFLSYCQKPAACPSGRFTEKCAFKSGGCALECPVNSIAGLDCDILFLTDDQSVARMITEIRSSALSRGKRIFALFSLCGFAAELAMMFSLLNIEGLIMRFDEKTSCRGFIQYAYGDMGSKGTVTSLRSRDITAAERIVIALKKRLS